MSQFDKKGDADLSNVSEPAAIASLLKQYLRDLPDTLIPANMTQSFVATQEGMSSVTWCCDRFLFITVSKTELVMQFFINMFPY